MILSNTEITTLSSKITEADFVDAIVNSSNNKLFGTSGVNGAIHKAAGEELRKACEELGGCKVGKAKITKGYNLPCKYIIHTVGPKWEDGLQGEEILLESCYRNVLNLAVEYNIRSIGFSSIGTGNHGAPGETAASIAVRTVIDFVKKHPTSFDKIIWFPHKTETKKAYDNVLKIYENVFKTESLVKYSKIKVLNVDFEKKMVPTHDGKCLMTGHIILPVKGIVNVLDSEGNQTLHLSRLHYCAQCKSFFVTKNTLSSLKEDGVLMCRVLSSQDHYAEYKDEVFADDPYRILAQYGYDIKNLQNMTDIQRGIILAMIIEYGVFSGREIIAFLEKNIQTGVNAPFYSSIGKNIDKWKRDKDFIAIYMAK